MPVKHVGQSQTYPHGQFIGPFDFLTVKVRGRTNGIIPIEDDYFGIPLITVAAVVVARQLHRSGNFVSVSEESEKNGKVVFWRPTDIPAQNKTHRSLDAGGEEARPSAFAFMLGLIRLLY
jgi:hypothetical protein